MFLFGGECLLPPANGVAKVMFSVLSVCLGNGHIHETPPAPAYRAHDSLDLTMQGPPPTFLNVFNLDLTVQGPSLPRLYPSVLDTRTYSWQAGGVLMECFLVGWPLNVREPAIYMYIVGGN